MTAVNTLNFSVMGGDDITLAIPLTVNLPETTLIGSTVYWTLYTTLAGMPQAQVLQKHSPSNGVVIVDATDIQVQIVGSDTLGLVPGNYYYEVVAKDTSGHHDTCMVGILTVSPSYSDTV